MVDMRQLVLLLQVPQTPSTFHPPAQGNASHRRDARQGIKIVPADASSFRYSFSQISAILAPLDADGS
jgi:hypothetical protein